MKTNHFNPDKKNQQAIMLHIRVMAGVLKFRQTYFKISVICLEKILIQLIILSRHLVLSKSFTSTENLHKNK